MFKVECPGCRASYQVDERRVPQDGLNMRCPKCGASFLVEQPGSGNADPLGASLGFTGTDTSVPPDVVDEQKAAVPPLSGGTQRPSPPPRPKAPSPPPRPERRLPSPPPLDPGDEGFDSMFESPDEATDAGGSGSLGAGRSEGVVLPDVPADAELPSLDDDDLTSFGEIDLPQEGVPSPEPSRPERDTEDPDGSGFGELELPPSGASMPSLPPSEVEGLTGDSARVERTSGGGTNFGEVNLEEERGSAQPSVGLDHGDSVAPHSDALEFQGIPTASVAPKEPGPGPAPSPAAARKPATPVVKPRKSRRVLVVGGIVFLGLVAGGSLTLVPDAGPFGAYWVVDLVRSGEYSQRLDDVHQTVQRELGEDVYPSAIRAFDAVDQARVEYPRVYEFPAYEAFVGYARELRFGVDPRVSARSKVLLDELKERNGLKHKPLALAAQAAAEGRLPAARQLLSELPANSLDAAVLRGELELRAGDGPAAVGAFERAVRLERTPRTLFGLARAKLSAGDSEAALGLSREALQQQPAHVGARLLLAELLLETGDRESEDRAAELIRGSALKNPGGASPRELVQAYTLMGDVELAHSRISAAEDMFVSAIALDPKATGALAGLGEALFSSMRYSESLARFQAALRADPQYLPGQIGAAKAQISLERFEDARALLAQAVGQDPKSVDAHYWVGVVEDELGNSDKAETSYRTAIEIGGTNPRIVDAYVALMNILSRRGEMEAAVALLDQARTELPETPAIHHALGDVALSQGRLEEALVEFTRALELDPEHVGARFKLGMTERRKGHFDQAVAHFDRVAGIDEHYPGLALERGLLFESAGRGEEALTEYEEALSKAPTDPDLMLRVGCARVSAGKSEDAERLLRDVLYQRPSSAEANHCLGRAQLAGGTRVPEAQRSLERAAELDPNKAEYHLYVGWAANVAGQPVKAERALKRALNLDQGLADAYWQRGVLRYRQGRARDAVKDLTRALELRPSRAEARAALASAYLDLGRVAKALAEWQLAVEARPANANWRFRYGKLLATHGKMAAAASQLTVALELGSSQEPEPLWMWEAHRLLGLALGNDPGAIPHWKIFLEQGPGDSPYRSEAIRALKRLGSPWEG